MSTLAPTADVSRNRAIDAVRGFALLGIFLVNVKLFGDAFGLMMNPLPPEGSGVGDAVVHYAVKTLCEGKFYPLFSMLFGMGLAMQWSRAKASGRSFVGVGIRRMIVLGVLGLAHGLLLWYGDILFIYSTAGIVMVFLVGLRTKTLAIVAASLIGTGVVLTTGLATLMVMTMPTSEDPQTAVVEKEATPAEAPGEEPAEAPSEATEESQDAEAASPFMRAIRVFEDPAAASAVGGPMASPAWIEAEREAYREGPYLQMLLFRVTSFAMYMVFTAAGFWWQVLGLMCVGAAMYKAGLFEARGEGWIRRLAVIGCIVGVLAGLLYAMLPHLAPMWVFMLGGNAVLMIGGPILSLGYLGVMTLLARSDWASLPTEAISRVGRMALTNYLLQTLTATWIFYAWGLGLFGQTSAVEKVGIVLGIYAAQVLLSVAWLQVFRYGPMEWLWRSATYLRIPPLLRTRGSSAAE